MNQTSKRLLFILGFTFLMVIVGSFALPAAPFKRLDMTSEGNGRKQSDWKYFGFIPISTVEMDPSIDATDDFLRALDASGLKTDPGFSRIRPDHSMVMSYVDSHKKSYFAATSYEASFKKLEANYAKQISGTSGVGAGSDVYFTGTLPSGYGSTVHLRSMGKTGKPGIDRIEISIHLDPK